MPALSSETVLMMRTLRDMNMSKFVAEDVPLFMSLIDDMFPGLRAERAAFPEVAAALGKVRRWGHGRQGRPAQSFGSLWPWCRQCNVL